MNLLSIDSGASTGWAHFDRGRLMRCGAFQADGGVPLNVLAHAPGCRVVVEVPRDRPGRRKGDVSDLIAQALRAGFVVGMIRSVGSALPEYWTPEQWKLQLPKEITTERARAALFPHELAIIPPGLVHDGWDAIGLGLVACGRLRRGMLPV